MGKEWYWGGSSKSSKRTTKKRANDGGGGGAAGTEGVAGVASGVPSGCMCAVFQLFDLPFATALNQRPSFQPASFHFPDRPPPVPKGAEAPRNSLEMEEEASVPLAVKQAQNLNIPMGIQIKTTRNGKPGTRLGSGSVQSDSDTAASSPATKTPTLVARLMGLDLLPENHSPRSSASSATTPYLNGKLSHLRPQQQPQQGRQQQSSSYSHHRRSFDCHELSSGAPRISSARKSDVDHYHHRLSLQLNKENMTPSEELVISRIKARLKGRELKPEEETRSPRQYARQIVKQVKESVSRRVGLDITNTFKNRENQLQQQQPEKRAGGGGRRDSDLVAQIKSKKKKVLTRVAEEEAGDSVPVVKQQNNKPKLVQHRKDHHVLDEMSKSKKQSFSTAEVVISNPTTPAQKSNVAVVPKQGGGIISLQEKEPPEGKKSRGKRMPPQTSDIMRNKQEEPFVRPTAATRGGNIPDKRCRKTPLSSELPSLILPVKKDPAPPATKLLSPQKQPQQQQVGLSNAQESKRCSSSPSQLPSNPSHTASYRHQHQPQQEEATRPLPSQENRNQDNNAATAEAAAEEEYITRILKRTGIDRDTPVSFTNWFSPAHPLDPTIFYHLEHITTATTTPPPSSGHLIPPCNRKLIFQLVNEILAGILKPYLNVKPWTTARSRTNAVNVSGRGVTGSGLVETLCKKIRSFPSANCQVLEDIDALIDKDFSDHRELRWRETAAEEEGEGIVTEVERELLDSLIHETALDILL
ncbi:unnamed protein product [Linum tenue]|uniref:DUF4378 domain-containing protein n=1 Tax=Linum tenue TaxID=586396 RepID=A0AAV0J2N1_9ROSI|nr:unnamed protein product [Linum tenue]